MKHTAGPWFIKWADNVFGKDENGEDRLVANCASRQSNFKDEDPENGANAQLISAAPDMLAALEAADKYPCAVCGNGYGIHFKDCIIGNAIAKAKGETL